MGVYLRVDEPIFTPGANTVFYGPFIDDILDHGPNNIQLSWTSEPTIDSQGAVFSDGTCFNGESPSIISGDFTFNVWINPTSSGTGGNIVGIGKGYPGYGYRYGANGSGYIGFTLAHVTDYNYGTSFSTLYGNRHNLVLVRSGTQNTLYLDNVQVGTYTGTSNPSSKNIYGGGGGMNHIAGHINHLIIEDKARTATERDDYYNLSKQAYGIS